MATRSDEEIREAQRHDQAFAKQRGAWIMPPHDWERFDRDPEPTNGYIYSVQQLGDIRGKHVLDLGCGTGWLSVILAKRGATVLGVDISAEAIRIGQELVLANGVADSVALRVGSAYDIPVPDAGVDLVIGQAILHHVREKGRVAEEIHRVLRPRGRAVFFEAFGNTRLLERLRLLVPISVDDVADESHWNEQLTYADLEPFKRFFTPTVREFQLFSRLDRIIRHPAAIGLLGRIDTFLLRHVPSLRGLARTIVVTLDK